MVVTLFLTSSPTGPLDGSRPVVGLDKMNGFVEKLKEHWVQNARVLMISATPDSFRQNDEMKEFFQNAFAIEDFSIRVVLFHSFTQFLIGLVLVGLINLFQNSWDSFWY